MNAIVLQTQLIELLKQAKKNRPTMKAANMGAGKVGRENYERFYGSITLRALPGERRLVLMQRTIGEDGKVLIVEAFIQAKVYASFVVSVELDNLYEWIRLAPAQERLELHCIDFPTHSQNGKVLKSIPALKIIANRCSARFKSNEQVLGENPIPCLTASDLWEGDPANTTCDNPVGEEIPCPFPPAKKVDLMASIVKEIVTHARTTNLENEMIILTHIIPSNTAYGTDRWIAHSGKGETHLKLILFKEQVGAIKLAGYDMAWFEQNKPFRCHIYVILNKERKIKEVLPPEQSDPAWAIMDGSPAPEKVKRSYVAGRKVDQSTAQASMARAKLCMKLGLPIDATDEEIESMQNLPELPEYAPAGYVQTIHPSDLQPGDVFVGDANQWVRGGDTFIGFCGNDQTPPKIVVGWYNFVIRTFRGNYMSEALNASWEVDIYREPIRYQLSEQDKETLRRSARFDADTPNPKMGWREDGQGGIESNWV